jgi:hypothetical protein
VVPGLSHVEGEWKLEISRRFRHIGSTYTDPQGQRTSNPL